MVTPPILHAAMPVMRHLALIGLREAFHVGTPVEAVIATASGLL